MTPMYFMERYIAEHQPPAITHPEFFYGFVGVTLAWQILFLIAARDPVRLRAVAVGGILEKFSFAVASFALFAQQRAPGTMTIFGGIDVCFAILLLIAFLRTARPQPAQHADSPVSNTFTAS